MSKHFYLFRLYLFYSKIGTKLYEQKFVNTFSVPEFKIEISLFRYNEGGKELLKYSVLGRLVSVRG